MEDRYLTTRLFYFTKKIIKINQAFYHYVHYNQNSITIKVNELHFRNMILFWDTLEIFLNKNIDFEQYTEIVKISKLKDKYKLLFSTNSKELIGKYGLIFPDEENEYYSALKIGEKIMHFLIRYKMLIFIPALSKLIKLKSNIL